MRVAIIYNEKDVFVEFSDSIFRDLLKTYIDKYGDVDLALDEIIKELKEKTKYK